MQSPPANAEATRVSSLSPAFARPGVSPRTTCWSARFTQTHAQSKAGGQQQPGIGHQAVIVEGDADAVGVLAW